MPLSSLGGGPFLPHRGGIVIKMVLQGHGNRPFFHIGVTYKFAPPKTHLHEQLGTYDPMPNIDNQKLLSLNIERTRYWMGQGATFSRNVAILLGKAGFLPNNPMAYQAAWRYRYKEAADIEAKKAAEAEGKTSSSNQPPSSSS